MSTPTDREFDREFEARLARRQTAFLKEFDPKALACLTLVPVWSRSLAEHCDFPRPEQWGDYLARLEAAGLVQQAPERAAKPASSPLRRFWMPETSVSDVARLLDRNMLAEWSGRLGETIMRLQPGDPTVPPATRQWAELAQTTAEADRQPITLRQLVGKSAARTGVDLGPASQMLAGLVSELVDTDQIAEAQRWVEAGKRLAGVLGGSLVATVTMAERRIEITIRQKTDQQYLARFIERREQLAAFRALMTGPDDLYALHYLGMGGVGKTMLVRHIGYQAPVEYRSPVSRVDFDYLSDEFPVRRPGELLLALAGDLCPHFSQLEHQKIYEALHASLVYLHEVISGEPSKSDPLANVRRPEFYAALDLFGSLLDALVRTAKAARLPDEQPARVVLVLDTCEEMMNLRAVVGDPLPRLAATFEIIERLHKRVPDVRIIFAGRRPLASGGVGWRATPAYDAESRPFLLPPRTYLRLHVIRGFDQEEADQLFDRFRDRPIPQDVRQAILGASPEHGTLPPLVADDGSRPLLLPPEFYQRLLAAFETVKGGERLDLLADDRHLGPALRIVPAADRVAAAIGLLLDRGTPDSDNSLVTELRELGCGDLADELESHLIRYSPFSLDMCSRWYAEDPELTAERIREGGPDPYVELRIVRRITQEAVRNLLPAAVLLRRFTEAMLAPVFSGLPDDLAGAFLDLSDYEWIDFSRDARTGKVWLEVDPNIHPRLLAYYQATDPAALAEVRRNLGPGLAYAVRSHYLRDQDPEEIATALALLPEAEAVRLWSEVEWRVPLESDWTRGREVAAWALEAEADVVRDSRPLVVAALSATQAAANIQLSPTYNATAGWQGVADALSQIAGPDADRLLVLWLGARAALGQFAAARLRGELADADALDTVRSLLAERASAEGPLASLAPYQTQQLDAALYAALEAWVDAAEEAGDPRSLSSGLDVDLRTLGDRALDPRHRIFALLLEGRILAQLGDGDGSRAALHEAESLATAGLPDTEQPGPWADWRAPALMRERVRLEWLRLRPELPMTEAEEPPEQQLEAWLRDAARDEVLAQIDGERLASAALSRLLDLQPVPADVLAGLEKAYHYDPARQPTCLVHRLAPPLFLALARGWLALGERDRAEELLLAVQESATTGALDASTVDAALQGLIELARRARDADRAEVLLASQAALDNPDAWALAALTGKKAADELPAPSEAWYEARLHAWWRVQSGLPPDRLEQVGELLRRAAEVDPLVQDADPNSLRFYALVKLPGLLDAREFGLVAGQDGIPTSDAFLLLNQLTSAPRSEQRPAEAQEALRSLLRWIALDANAIDAMELATRGWLSAASPRTRPEFSHLIPGPVGVRRAAVIALDEGELLALRLPGRAAPLLQQATSWFQEAGDPVGATQAAVLWALAALRAEDTHKASGARAVQDALFACRSVYKDLTEARTQDRLPEWSLVQEQARSGDRGILDQVGTYWRGWIARIMAARILLDAQPMRPASEKWPPVVAQLASLAFRPVPPELLPTDLAEAVEPPPEEGFLETWWGTLALAGGVVLFFGGILVGLFFGFRALLTLGAPELADNTGISIGTYIVTLLMLASLRPGWRRLRKSVEALLASRAEVTVGIRTTGAASEKELPAELRLSWRERRLRLVPPSLPRTAAQIVQEQIALPVSVPGAAAADQVAMSEIASRLADLATRSGRWGIVVRLAVPAELSGHPWEAWLHMAVVKDRVQQLPSTVSKEVRRRAESLTVHFVRAGAQEKALQAAQPFIDGGVRVAVGEIWAGLFGGAWNRAVRRERLGVGPVAHHLGKDEAVRVLHVIGHPVRTRSGPRMQVSTGGFDSSADMSQSSSRAGAELVGTRDLAQAALRLAGRLVILQAEPSPEVWSREVGRNEATILRDLAAEVSASGVPAVLILPTLAPGLADSAVQHLARALRQTPRRWRDDLTPWLAAVERIRQEITAWRPGDGEKAPAEELDATLAELAWDVSLSWREVR